MSKSISQVRDILGRIGNHSHTSFKFQDEILEIIKSEKDRGSCVIEVGCYHGGLTAQLAAVCTSLQKHLYVVDINADYMNVAKYSVSTAVGDDNSTYFLGTLRGFYELGQLVHDPILVFLDGDHRYPGIIEDIGAILASERSPYAVAFHDFSLRYAVQELADVRVDKAIYDVFGTDIRVAPLGEIAGSGTTIMTQPQADGHYHEIGQPEGVLLLYQEMRAAAQKHRAEFSI